MDTMARLERAGIASAGAGADLAASRTPALLESPGGTVALLAATLIEPAGFPAGPAKAGVNPGRTGQDHLLADIAAAKRRADWVIVSLHWGVEHERRASLVQRRLAHQAVDAGADLVLGHHPHVLQGLELYRNRLIAYSLGDFVFDHYSRETGEAVVLRLDLAPAGPPRVELVPVYLNDAHGIPAPLSGSEAQTVLERMRRLSAPFGLDLEIRGDRAYAGADS
jgi:poly-gamma-glutamate synthesis protein (capsule biosynthesis protein)